MIVYHENWAQLKINHGVIKVRQINDKPIGLQICYRSGPLWVIKYMTDSANS